MARYQNPFIAGPWSQGPSVGQGLTQLAQAFVPSAGDVASYASADLSRTRAREIDTRMGGYSSLADVFRSASANPEGFRQVLGSLAQTMDPAALAGAGQLLRAYGFSQGVDGQTGDNLYRGAGGAYDNTEAGFRATDTTRRRGQDVAAGASIAGARIGADAQLGQERLRQDGYDRRMAPEVNPGNVVVVPPNSPLASRATPDGRIQGNPSLGVEQGAAANALRTQPGMPPAEVQANRRVLPGAPGAEIRAEDDTPRGTAGRPPANVPVSVSKRIEEIIAAGTDVDGSQYQFDPEAQRWLRARTEALFQAGDAGVRGSIENAFLEARREFLEASPGRGDSSWNPLSSRTYTMPPTLRQPVAPSGARNAMSSQTVPPPLAGGAGGVVPGTILAPPGRGAPSPQSVLQPRPGDTVRQNGRLYIIQPDGSAAPVS